jgi:hypothetical protein
MPFQDVSFSSPRLAESTELALRRLSFVAQITIPDPGVTVRSDEVFERVDLIRESTVATRKKSAIPRVTVPRNATLRQVYAKLRKEFTAADLQKFTELEPVVPADQLLGELEAIHRAETKKRRKPHR